MTSIKPAIFTTALLLSSAVAQADVAISKKPTQNMSCDAGICTATAQKAVLNVSDLQNMLASGDVAVKTGSATNNISIDQPLTWTSTSRLTLDAQHSVTFKKLVVVAGAGAVTITTNDGARNGTLSFLGRGKLDFSSLQSDLTIDGVRYRLAHSITQLAELALQHPGGNLALALDYDATLDGVYSSSPIATPFKSTFNGLGHVISHVFVSDQSDTDVGFFGTLQTKGIVTSLQIKSSALNGTLYVGGVAGYSQGLIENSSFAGRISGVYATGGIVGRNDGIVTNARSKAKVSSEFAGGIAGQNAGLIDRSFASQIVQERASGNLGDLVGINSSDFITQAGTIRDSYALEDVKAGTQSAVGGLVGYNPQDSTISTSYSTGRPSAKDGSLVGGFAGDSEGTIQASYWDITTSGTSQGVGRGSDAGLTGLTDDQLKAGLPDGFDPKVWGSDPEINNGYPYLLDNPP